MKRYKSSWVRTTRINPWGINLGFATILLCIYNELLPPTPPHSRSSNTFKRKEPKRALCPPNELVGGEKGVHGSESNSFSSPSTEFWNPLEEARSEPQLNMWGSSSAPIAWLHRSCETNLPDAQSLEMTSAS